MLRSQAGVTLIEMFVILVILAALAAMIIPTMGNILAVTKTKGASEEVAMAIRRTRQLAITNAVNYCVSFPTTSQYKISTPACADAPIADTGLVTLSQEATVSGTSSFTFDPIGSTTAGAVTVTINDPSTCIVTMTVTAAGAVQLASPPC